MNYEHLAEYKTYRRECRKEGIKRPMDYEQFADELDRENDREAAEWNAHIRSYSSVWRYC